MFCFATGVDGAVSLKGRTMLNYADGKGSVYLVPSPYLSSGCGQPGLVTSRSDGQDVGKALRIGREPKKERT